MRELRTLEVDRWEPSEKKGMVKHAGMVSPQEVFDALRKHLEEVGLLPDEYFLAQRWKYEKNATLPNYSRAVCSVNWGDSEGIYLNISLMYQENNEIKYFDFATGKTLGTNGDDFLRMSRIGAECSMMLNGRGEFVRFYEEDKYIVNKELKTKETPEPPLEKKIFTANQKKLAGTEMSFEKGRKDDTPVR